MLSTHDFIGQDKLLDGLKSSEEQKHYYPSAGIFTKYFQWS